MFSLIVNRMNGCWNRECGLLQEVVERRICVIYFPEHNEITLKRQIEVTSVQEECQMLMLEDKRILE
jgi:hypothetical protein